MKTLKTMNTFKFTFLTAIIILAANCLGATTRQKQLINYQQILKKQSSRINTKSDSVTITLVHGGMPFDDFRIKLISLDDPNYAVDYYFDAPWGGTQKIFKVPAGNYEITLEANILDPYNRATPYFSLTPGNSYFGNEIHISDLYLSGNISVFGVADMYSPELGN